MKCIAQPYVLSALMVFSTTAISEEICDVVKGAAVIAQDGPNTFLGKVANSYDGQSIFNEFGTYGSEFNSVSIWNQFGNFGNPFNSYSVSNEMTSTPPMIIKGRKVIGYLTANRSLKSSISANLLKELCKDEM